MSTRRRLRRNWSATQRQQTDCPEANNWRSLKKNSNTMTAATSRVERRRNPASPAPKCWNLSQLRRSIRTVAIDYADANLVADLHFWVCPAHVLSCRAGKAADTKLDGGSLSRS